MEESRPSKQKRGGEKAAKRQRKAGGLQRPSDQGTPRQAKQTKREALAETHRETQQTTSETAKGLPSHSNNGSLHQEDRNAGNSVVTAAELLRSPSGEFLCIFVLAAPGLVGLNKLALRLVALKNDGLIHDWHIRGLQDRKTKAIIGFDTEADAAIAKSKCSTALKV